MAESEQPVERVELERSGGMAGISRKMLLDVSGLPPSDRSALQQLFNEARFFDLPPELPTPARREDRFEYAVTIHATGQTHRVHFYEGAAPASLKKLVDFVAERASVSE